PTSSAPAPGFPSQFVACACPRDPPSRTRDEIVQDSIVNLAPSAKEHRQAACRDCTFSQSPQPVAGRPATGDKRSEHTGPTAPTILPSWPLRSQVGAADPESQGALRTLAKNA